MQVETVECVLRLVDYFMCEDLRVCVERFMEKTLCFLNAAFYFQVALQYRLNTVSGLWSFKNIFLVLLDV